MSDHKHVLDDITKLSIASDNVLHSGEAVNELNEDSQPILKTINALQATIQSPLSSDEVTPSFVSTDTPPITVASISIPDGFIHHDTIVVFGSGLSAELYAYSGPLPKDIDATHVTPSYELALLSGHFNLAQIFPSLSNTIFDAITLSDITVTYQTVAFDKTKAIGWTLEGKVNVGKETSGLFDTLTKVLGVGLPVVHLVGHLEDASVSGRTWLDPFPLHSLVFEGSVVAVTPILRSGFNVTELRIHLQGTRADPPANTTSPFPSDFSILGQMHLKVLGQEITAPLNFEISPVQGGLKFDASPNDGLWINAFEIPGLNLSNVAFTSTLKQDALANVIDCEVSAVFQTRAGPIPLRGSYTSDSFTLSSHMTNFRWDDVHNIYNTLQGKSLHVLDLDISTGSASLVVSSATGLNMTISDINIGPFFSANATVIYHSDGLQVIGTLSRPVNLEGLQLQSATMQVSLVPASSGGNSTAAITGEIAFLGRVLSATAYLSRHPETSSTSDPSTLEWMAFASMSTDKPLTLAHLVPRLHGCFLQDIILHSPVLVIASSDKPQAPKGLDIPGGVVSKGVQISATLGELSQLNTLTRGPSPSNDLILRAGWTEDSGFTLDVTILALSEITLGHGTKLNPGHISIVTVPRPSLLMSASIRVPISTQAAPLVFDAILSIDAIEASVTGEMDGYWINPFGISEHLKIGPSLALKVDIILAQFLATGTPSGFGFSGNLQMGKVVTQLEFDVSETATGELLHGKLDSLDVNDVVEFVKDISKLNIPSPPPFVSFQSIDVYMSPLGATIGSKTYPPGASFSADAILFGVRGDVLTSMDTSGFEMRGEVDHFKLGPFTVLGADGAQTSGPTIDVQFNEAAQHVLVEGLLQLFDVSAALQFTFDVTPRLDFSVKFDLHFIDELSFTVDGSLFGPCDFQDLSKLDFKLQAILQQDILEYITHEVTQEFTKARENALHDVQSAEADVSRLQRLTSGGLAETQLMLDRARANWEKRLGIARLDSQNAMNNYEKRRSQLEANVRSARQQLEKAFEGASARVHQPNDTNVESPRLPEDGGKVTPDQLQLGLEDAENGVKSAETKFDNILADIRKHIASAQKAVDMAKGELDGVNRTIHEAEIAPWWNAPAKASLPALYVNRITGEGELAATNGLLVAAQAMLHGPKYLRAQDAVDAARQAFNIARTASQSAGHTAEVVLLKTDESEQVLLREVDARTNAGEGASLGPTRAALREAENALDAHIADQVSLVAPQPKVVSELRSTDEWKDYQTALAAVGEVERTTEQLILAKTALSAARGKCHLLTDLTLWASKHSLIILDLKRVTLSGSFHDLANVKGYLGFNASIDGTFVGRAFRLSPVLDLRDPAKFIGSIFERLWEDIGAGRTPVASAL